MNQEELTQKLAGDSFQEYLNACQHLPEYVANKGALDQEIIERALFVNLMPLWARHEDLLAKYELITSELPLHAGLLENDETKRHLIGLSVFVNGLMASTFDVSGFFWCSNGYMCCHTACEAIAAHYEGNGKSAEAAYFLSLGEWFMEIYQATTAVFRAIMNITSWTEEMVLGLTNFLNASLQHYGVFEWILSGLYKVVQEPLIKEKVFGRYIKAFTNAGKKLKEEKKESEWKDVAQKVKNLKRLAQGKTV